MADIRETLVRLCAAFNAHDLDQIMFFANDCVLDQGTPPMGRSL